MGETYILEAMNLKEACNAYERYPIIRKKLQVRMAEYQRAVADLKKRNPISLKSAEMKAVDALAEDVDRLTAFLVDLRATLLKKIDDLIAECRTLEDTAAEQGATLAIDGKGLEHGRALLKQALRFKDNNAVTECVDTVYQARECFSGYLSKAACEWLRKHQECISLLQESMEN